MPDATPLLTKRCSKCGEHKPLEEFGVQAGTKTGRRSACKNCKTLGDRLRYANDPEFALRLKISARASDKQAKQSPAVRRRNSIKALRHAIAIATCKRLGIDLTKLAKEQYDAEQNR